MTGDPAKKFEAIARRLRRLALALAGRVFRQSELLSREAEAPRPWWEQAAANEGGCPP